MRYGARVLDVSMTTMTLEFTGTGATIDMFVEEIEGKPQKHRFELQNIKSVKE